MCSEPAMRAPFSGCFGPYSSRVAIRPGISVSASEISLRPKSASDDVLDDVVGEGGLLGGGGHESFLLFSSSFRALQRGESRNLEAMDEHFRVRSLSRATPE